MGAGYGWFVGWFYGIALLVTVASVDTGVVPYVTSLFHNWFGTNWNLGLMLNVVVPTGLTSGRGLFNYDWITLVVMVVIASSGRSSS